MSFFAGLNLWALLFAAFVSFAFGGIWYTVLSERWKTALSGSGVVPTTKPLPQLLAATFLAQLVMAWLFAGLLLHLSQGGLPASIRSGAVSAIFLWLGFILMPMVVNHMYQGAKWSLTAIDGAHWLGVMILQGAILGAFALK